MIRIKRKTIKLIAGIFIAVFLVLGINLFLEMWERGEFIRTTTRHPVKSLGVVIDIEQRGVFFEQVTKFANYYNYKIKIRPIAPTEEFSIEIIVDKNTRIFGDNIIHPSAYKFYFYAEDSYTLTSQELINNLHENLKKFVSEVPNVRIFEE